MAIKKILPEKVLIFQGFFRFLGGKNIILDKINIVDDNHFDTEKISFTVLDIVDEKIIIEADEYLTDSFVVFNRYKPSDIN